MSSEDAPTLPPRADVVILGGGIAGVSAAYYLARAGVSVLVCEKGRIGAEQSSRNWGFVRQQGRDPAEIPLIIESLDLWKGLNAEIGAETGFRQTGVMYLADDAAGLKKFEDWLPHARDYQLDTKMMSSKEIATAVPGATKRFYGGMVTPSDGKAEPSLASKAIAGAAENLGARILENCAVRGVEKSGGKISGVVTEHGTVACDAVLVAGGAWSRIFLRSLGVDFPQLTLRASVQRTSPGPDVLDGGVWTPGFAIRKRLDGGYTLAHGGISISDLTPDHFRYFTKFIGFLRHERSAFKIRFGKRFFDMARLPVTWGMDEVSPFEKARILDPEPHAPSLNLAFENLKKALPAFKDVEIVEQWAGYIDVTPDGVPAISPIDQQPGLYIASGFSGHGFGIGPGAGKLAAEIIQGKTGCVDPTPFRFDRFG